MSYTTSRLCLGFMFLAGAAQAQASAPADPQVSPARLCVTQGSIDPLPERRLAVDAVKMRAYVNRSVGDAIEMRFKYLGAATAQPARDAGAQPTHKAGAAPAGDTREQFGLKLRAGDACNLVSVNWRVQPETQLVVSVKSNPDQHLAARCASHPMKPSND